MPILDMPLEKLKNYGGCSPKPSDFDSFWDGELEKIHSFDGKYEIKPCKEIAVKGYKIESLDFCAPDGSVINARIVRPDDDKTHPVVFRFHGKSGNIGAVSEDLAYASAGFASAALNCRSQSGFSDDRTDRGFFGQGGLVVRGLSKGRDYLYYKDVYLDVVRFVDIVKNLKFCHKTRLFARGGSQGGALTVVCAALCPEIKAAAPEFPFLSDFRRVYEMDLMCNAYQEMKDYVRCFCPWDGLNATRCGTLWAI